MKDLNKTKLNLFGLSETEKKIAFHKYMDITKAIKSMSGERNSYPNYIYFEDESHFFGNRKDEFDKIGVREIKPVFSKYWEGITPTTVIRAGDLIEMEEGCIAKVLFIGNLKVFMCGVVGLIGEYSTLISNLTKMRKEVTDCEFQEVKPSLDRKAETLFNLMASQLESNIFSTHWGDLDGNQKEEWKYIAKNIRTIAETIGGGSNE